MKHILGIFNPEWELVAVVEFAGSDMHLRTLGEHSCEQIVVDTLTRLRGNAAESRQPEKDETGCVTGFKSFTPEEDGYIGAVGDELRKVGARVFEFDAELEALVRLIPVPARQQLLPEVLFMEASLAREVLSHITM